MIEKDKLQELERQINERNNEIQDIKKKRSAANDDVSLKVLYDKRLAEVTAVLDSLKRTLKAVTYQPPVPTDKDILLAGIRKHIRDKEKRITDAENNVKQAEKELSEIEGELSKATETGNVDAVVACSTKRDDLKQRLVYLREMEQAIRKRKTFPEDAITQEWEAVCKRVQPDFNALLERIELLANEYRAAGNELVAMKDTLLQVRREMGQLAEKDGYSAFFRPILTVGVNVEPLEISKADGLKPGFIFPLSGMPL